MDKDKYDSFFQLRSRRIFGLFDKENNLLMKIKGDLYHPDFIDWDEAEKKGIRCLTT